MNSFIFKTSNKFYVIITEQKIRSEKLARYFTDFFASRYNGEITDEMYNKTKNNIYKRMYNASIRRSDDFEWYFIHTKNSGATVPENEMIFIEI